MISWYEWLMLLAVPSIIFMIFQMVLTKVLNKKKLNKTEDNTSKLGIQALLRNELMKEYKEFSKQGWIDISDKQNYDNMYVCYHNLGKNGVMDHMHDEIMQLPTAPKN